MQKVEISRLAIAAASLAAIAWPVAAAADDTVQAAKEGDASITVTATRAPLKIEDAPATVTVIDAEAIADGLVTDIRDLVRFEPGVTVRRPPVSARHLAPLAVPAMKTSTFAGSAETAC